MAAYERYWWRLRRRRSSFVAVVDRSYTLRLLPLQQQPRRFWRGLWKTW